MHSPNTRTHGNGTTIIASLVVYFGFLRPHVDIKVHGTYITHPQDLSEFHLMDNNGQPLHKENLKGQSAQLVDDYKVILSSKLTSARYERKKTG